MGRIVLIGHRFKTAKSMVNIVKFYVDVEIDLLLEVIAVGTYFYRFIISGCFAPLLLTGQDLAHVIGFTLCALFSAARLGK